MSQQRDAIDHLMTDPLMARLLRHAYDRDHREIHFDEIEYGCLSGGEKTAISWVWVIWTDTQAPTSNDGAVGYAMRDPFEGFATLGIRTQLAILEAMAIRHGVAPEDGPI